MVLAGNLAGITDWLGIDPAIIRVIYVLLGLFSTGLPSILLYTVLVVLIPSGRTESDRSYGYQSPYNRSVRNENPYAANKEQRKEAEKIDDDRQSGFQ